MARSLGFVRPTPPLTYLGGRLLVGASTPGSSTVTGGSVQPSDVSSNHASEVHLLAVGLGARTRLLPQQPAVHLLAQPDPVALVDAMRPAIAAGRTVLAIHPAWRDDLRRALETARASLDVDAVALHASELPPLAGAVLVAQAATLAQLGVTLGPLAGALPALEGKILPVSWLGSVTRLSRLTPTMKQHVRSLLPGAAFFAYGGAAPRVERIDRSDPRLYLPLDLAGATIALSAHPQGQREAVERALLALGMSGRVVEVPPLDAGPDWWGTDRLIELAVFMTDVDDLRRHVSTQPSTCPWCRRTTASDPCPACGMRRLAPVPARG